MQVLLGMRTARPDHQREWPSRDNRNTLVCIAPKEVLVMPQPGDERAARRASLRASHADREQVVDTLKDAFVQGRLTKDEFDSRVGHALAARTYADLATLSADLPAMPPAARPPRKPVPPREPVPARPANTAVKNGARVIAATTVLTGGVWAGALLSQTDSQALGGLVFAFTFLWFGIVMLVGSVMLESRFHKRSGLNPS
jgi:hypothetical protein